MRGVSKYKNVPVIVDGKRFDSKREAARFGQLRLLERAGQIEDLQCQVPYVLSVNGSKIGKFIADFVYLTPAGIVCEDVKSKPTITPLFRWKAKHMLAEHGVKVEIVT